MRTRSAARRTLRNASLLLAGATALGALAGTPDLHFKEGGLVNLASGALLLWIARLASQIGRVRRAEAAAIWRVAAIGFAFLAADELFAIHENLDKLVHWLFGIRETPLTDRLDDAIVGLYGVAGAALAFAHRAELLRWRSARPYAVWGAALACAMVVLDAATNRSDLFETFLAEPQAKALESWLSVAEDALKLYAETCWMLAAQDVLGAARAAAARDPASHAA
ncbi:MAG: hypothetical protein DCC71_14800 [Proteobacteria bacterium]|nr:MAG: hypothetical protein DCC71_14800 [Pseudomonadota bacterium]